MTTPSITAVCVAWGVGVWEELFVGVGFGDVVLLLGVDVGEAIAFFSVGVGKGLFGFGVGSACFLPKTSALWTMAPSNSAPASARNTLREFCVTTLMVAGSFWISERGTSKSLSLRVTLVTGGSHDQSWSGLVPRSIGFQLWALLGWQRLDRAISTSFSPSGLLTKLRKASNYGNTRSARMGCLRSILLQPGKEEEPKCCTMDNLGTSIRRICSDWRFSFFCKVINNWAQPRWLFVVVAECI